MVKSIVDVNPAVKRLVVSTTQSHCRLWHSHKILIPLYGVGVEVLSEGPPPHRTPSVRLPALVERGHRTPVERTSNDVDTLFGVQWPVPSRLHNVNFSIGSTSAPSLNRDHITHPLIGQGP